MTIAENIILLKRSVPENIRIVTVSKMQPVHSIMEAYRAGQRIFGENKARELAEKQAHLPGDIEWHFIGHLQSNKIKYIAPFISLIHSIDGLNLLAEVNRGALKNNRIIDCLLQFHIATEETKFGMDIEEARMLLTSEVYKSMKNIRITGVMGMGSFSDDQQLVRREFKSLYSIFVKLKTDFFKDPGTFETVSMGMSGDYLTAIEEGSTMIRIGTSIFGENR
ncbi:MAG: YggS family pyridoxal phosphate-dependent enzyme [Bacteroidales bacterium]